MATENVRCGRGSWVQKIGKCIRDFGWHGVSMDDIQNLSEEDFKGMLECCVVKSERRVEGADGCEAEIQF